MLGRTTPEQDSSANSVGYYVKYYLMLALVSIGSFLKHYVAPIIVSTGRLVTASGGAIFTYPKFLKYLTGTPDNASRLPVSSLIVIANIILNLATRVPNIFRLFNPRKKIKNNEKEAESKEKHDEISWRDLGLKGKIIYGTLMPFTACSVTFASTSTYLGSVTLMHFIVDLSRSLSRNGMTSDDATENPTYGNIDQLIPYIGIFFFLNNFLSYLAYNVKKENHNTKVMAKYIETKGLPWNRDTAKTIAISALGIIATPFIGYFQTKHSLEALMKLPFLADMLSEGTIVGLAYLSSFSSTKTYILTSTASTYKALHSPSQSSHHTNRACWEVPASIIVYTAGTIDGLNSATASFVSVTSTSKEIFDIDDHETSLIVGAIAGATSLGLNNWFFTVHEGWKDTLKHVHERRIDSQPERQPLLTNAPPAEPNDDNEYDGNTTEEETDKERAMDVGVPYYSTKGLGFFNQGQNNINVNTQSRDSDLESANSLQTVTPQSTPPSSPRNSQHIYQSI